MSFKKWSVVQNATRKSQADDKVKAAPAIATPAVQPEQTPAKPVVQTPTATKS
jgi:hypothetical protein